MISKPTKHKHEHISVEITHCNSLSPSRPIKLLLCFSLWSLLLLPPMWPQSQSGRRVGVARCLMGAADGAPAAAGKWASSGCGADSCWLTDWLTGRSRETRTDEEIRDRRRAPCSPVTIMDLIRSRNSELVARATIILLAVVHGELEFEQQQLAARFAAITWRHLGFVARSVWTALNSYGTKTSDLILCLSTQ